MTREQITERFYVGGVEVVLRPPQGNDLEGLLEHINSLVKERAMISVQEEKTIEEEAQWLSDILRKIEKKKIVVLVVEVAGKIMGIASVASEEFPQNHIGGFGISLRKEVRKRGIGERLLKKVIKSARDILGVKIVMLQVMATNHSAMDIYTKCGFSEAMRIKNGYNHYGQFVDLVIMLLYI